MNLPSLSELLQAYHNNGAADAINQGVQGVQTGVSMAAARQKAANDQANALATQSIQKQSADAQTREANSKFVPAGIAAALAAHQPLPAGSEVPSSSLDSFNQVEAKKIEAQTALAQQDTLRRLALNQQNHDAELRAQEQAAATSERARQGQNAAATQILDNSSKSAPGFFTANVSNPINKLLHHGQDLPAVQQYSAQQQAANQLFQGQQPTLPVLGNGVQAQPVYRHFKDGHTEVSRDGGKTFTAAQ
jgi:hypothetical protein